jgi:hypothetical protein
MDKVEENFDYDSILTASSTPKISQANKRVFQSSNTSPNQPSQAHPRKPKPTQHLKTFGKQEFTASERERIRQLLAKKLQHDEVQTRPGAHGGKDKLLCSAVDFIQRSTLTCQVTKR